MANLDLHWLAGILEGEGYFALEKKPRKIGWKRRIRIRCQMTDKDIIERIYNIVKCGNIYFKASKNPKWKSTWAWELNDRNSVISLCKVLLPIMGDRRKQKIAEMLNT